MSHTEALRARLAAANTPPSTLVTPPSTLVTPPAPEPTPPPRKPWHKRSWVRVTAGQVGVPILARGAVSGQGEAAVGRHV